MRRIRYIVNIKRMTTSISSGALLNLRKIFGKQKVEKDSIKEKKKSQNLSTTLNTFTFMSFVA